MAYGKHGINVTESAYGHHHHYCHHRTPEDPRTECSYLELTWLGKRSLILSVPSRMKSLRSRLEYPTSVLGEIHKMIPRIKYINKKENKDWPWLKQVWQKEGTFSAKNFATYYVNEGPHHQNKDPSTRIRGCILSLAPLSHSAEGKSLYPQTPPGKQQKKGK